MSLPPYFGSIHEETVRVQYLAAAQRMRRQQRQDSRVALLILPTIHVEAVGVVRADVLGAVLIAQVIDHVSGAIQQIRRFGGFFHAMHGGVAVGAAAEHQDPAAERGELRERRMGIDRRFVQLMSLGQPGGVASGHAAGMGGVEAADDARNLRAEELRQVAYARTDGREAHVEHRLPGGDIIVGKRGQNQRPVRAEAVAKGLKETRRAAFDAAQRAKGTVHQHCVARADAQAEQVASELDARVHDNPPGQLTILNPASLSFRRISSICSKSRVSMPTFRKQLVTAMLASLRS